MNSVLILLSFIWSICYGFDTFEEASIFADKVALSIHGWYDSEIEETVTDTLLYQLSSDKIDNFELCINGECDVGAAEQVLQKWAPYQNLFKNGIADCVSVVSKFGKKYVGFDFQLYYKVQQEDDLKALHGAFIAYVDDNGKLTAFHEIFEINALEMFLKTLNDAVSKQEL
eukprot:744639_1